MLKITYVNLQGEIEDAVFTCHQDTTTVGATTYYLLKKETAADAAGTGLTASGASVAAVVWGSFVFQLTNVKTLLAATWAATYRAYTSSGSCAYNEQIDISVVTSADAARATIATGVSAAGTVSNTSYATHTGANYSFSAYTVTDQTDWLRVQFECNVTTKKSGSTCYLMIDDNTLATGDQTKVSGVLTGFGATGTTAQDTLQNTLLGLKPSIKTRFPTKRLTPLLGLKSFLRIGKLKKVSANLGLLVNPPYKLFEINIVPLLGLASSRIKKLAKSIKPLLGLLSLRRKLSRRVVSALIGLSALVFKPSPKTFSPLLGLISSTKKSLSKTQRVLLGLLSLR